MSEKEFPYNTTPGADPEYNRIKKLMTRIHEDTQELGSLMAKRAEKIGKEDESALLCIAVHPSEDDNGGVLSLGAVEGRADGLSNAINNFLHDNPSMLVPVARAAQRHITPIVASSLN